MRGIFKYRIFYGIGVDLGDPKLLTLKAINIIKEVDFNLLHRKLRKKKIVSLYQLPDLILERMLIVKQVFPMVVDFENHLKLGS